MMIMMIIIIIIIQTVKAGVLVAVRSGTFKHPHWQDRLWGQPSLLHRGHTGSGA
jgi:hypothetical protein